EHRASEAAIRPAERHAEVRHADAQVVELEDAAELDRAALRTTALAELCLAGLRGHAGLVDELRETELEAVVVDREAWRLALREDLAGDAELRERDRCR